MRTEQSTYLWMCRGVVRLEVDDVRLSSPPRHILSELFPSGSYIWGNAHVWPPEYWWKMRGLNLPRRHCSLLASQSRQPHQFGFRAAYMSALSAHAKLMRSQRWMILSWYTYVFLCTYPPWLICFRLEAAKDGAIRSTHIQWTIQVTSAIHQPLITTASYCHIQVCPQRVFVCKCQCKYVY